MCEVAFVAVPCSGAMQKIKSTQTKAKAKEIMEEGEKSEKNAELNSQSVSNWMNTV